MLYKSENLLDDKVKTAMMEFGYAGGPVSIVCKCNSPKEAHDMAEQAGLGSQWFLPTCCEELPDGVLDLYPETEMAVSIDGENYLQVEEVRNALLR